MNFSINLMNFSIIEERTQCILTQNIPNWILIFYFCHVWKILGRATEPWISWNEKLQLSQEKKSDVGMNGMMLFCYLFFKKKFFEIKKEHKYVKPDTMTFGEVLCIFLPKQNFDYLSVRVEDFWTKISWPGVIFCKVFSMVWTSWKVTGKGPSGIPVRRVPYDLRC